MHRRDFLRLSSAASASLLLPNAVSAALSEASASERWRTFEVVTRVEVLRPAGVTHVWLPAPLAADVPYIKALGDDYVAEGGTAGLMTEAKYGARILWAEWPADVKPILVQTSRFSTRDFAVDLSKPGNAKPEDPAVLAKFTGPTELMPTDGAVKDLSSSIVKEAGAKTDIEKARALYEWIVENTYRDGKVRGCGTGDVKFMIENKAWGGKCADLNALYVTLARAEGLPARDVYGVRVADSALGYKSLGKSGDITRAQHCRAEVYLQSHGWVPVDPADVRKVILEEGGGKAPDDPMVLAARKRLFGSWEMNWLAFNFAHDLNLPNSTRGKIAFLMYPQCETGDTRLDPLDPDNFRYQMTSRELTA
jgi:transglutaminase-like putative cysteine protease